MAISAAFYGFNGTGGDRHFRPFIRNLERLGKLTVADIAASNRPAPGNARTVQEYIDELPVWSDGTTLKSTPMTGMQWRIWALAASGKFFEGFVVFMGGVTVPLITREFHLAEAEKGLVTSASLAGILVGTILLGSLSDYFGRKRMFIAEMIIFCLFLALLIMVQNFLSLVICLFAIGMALGCDYPTAHMIISENIPSAARGRLVLGAFAFQAVGAMCGIGIGAFVLVLDPSLDAWRWMYATALLPAVLITVARFFITESANWLIVRGAHDEVELGRAAGVDRQRGDDEPDGAAEEAEHLQPDTPKPVGKPDREDDADDQERGSQRRGLGRVDAARDQVGRAADLVRAAAESGGDHGRGENADAVGAEILQEPRRRREDRGAQIVPLEERQEAFFRRARLVGDVADERDRLRVDRRPV